MKTQIISYSIEIIDSIGIAIIIRGVIKGLIKFLITEKNILSKKAPHATLNNIRCTLASYFLLGLELMVASDIIGAIIKPDTRHLFHLAILVTVRIMIGYFLNRELKQDSHKNM